MPSTHVNLNIHLVFSTKNRQCFLAESWRDRLFDYLGGITRNLGAIPWAVGGADEHAHVLLGMRAIHRLADLTRDIKQGSSRWIHETLQLWEFAWQEGYGAFSISQSHVEAERRYILNQAEHHRRVLFQEEYLEFLRRNGVEFDERYLW